MKKSLILTLFLFTLPVFFGVVACENSDLNAPADPEKADLTANITEARKEVRVGTAYRIVTRIGNAAGNGGLNVTNADNSSFRVVIRLVDADDPSRAVILRNLPVAGLSGGSDLDWFFFWDQVPQIRPGSYRLEAFVDADSQIDETDEQNNVDSVLVDLVESTTLDTEAYCFTEGYACLKNEDCCLNQNLRCDLSISLSPDLSAGTCVRKKPDLTVRIDKSPGQIRTGERQRIITTVINRKDDVGIPVDSAFKIRLLLAYAGDDYDNLGKKFILRELDVMGLDLGKEFDWLFFWDVPPVYPGRYRLEAFVDSDSEIDETYESNNRDFKKVTLMSLCSDVDEPCSKHKHCCSYWGLECNSASRTCQLACGSEGRKCCDGVDCDRGLNCVGSGERAICQASCGSEGQQCCGGSACDPGFECNSDGICQAPCGLEDQQCCDGESPCSGALVCAGDGTCQQCGSGGQICCDNGCADGFVCNDNSGLCEGECGEAGKKCCSSGNACGQNLKCTGSGSSAVCQSCGQQGQACCSTSLQCTGGLVCVSGSCENPPSVQQQCGQQGQACCSTSLQCTGGLVCVNNACAMPVSGFNICGRTPQVQDEILNQLSSAYPGITCDQVTLAQLRTISELDLRSKGITALKPGDFAGLTNMVNLTFGNNRLVSLPDGVFDGLTNLEWLDLYENSLESLPDNVFDDLTNLERLDLDQNSLVSLPDGVFDRLTNLQLLYLVHNPLVSLPDGVFDRLTNLERLYMSDNDLGSLSVGVFDKLTRLQDLGIASNGLVSLPDGVFDKLTKLRRLVISDNSIASLQPGIFENLLELENLQTYGNGFSCIPRNAFGSRTDDDLSTIILVYPNTPEIGICSTQCGFANQPCCSTSPQCTGGLVCVNNACAMPVSGFNICGRTSQVQDEILNQLSSAYSGITCDQVTLAQLRTVSELDLNAKGITALNAGDFDGLTNLVNLTLYRNSLVSLPDGVFDGLTNLERLELDQNSLESLPDGVFDRLTNLRLLYLVRNRLVSLPDGVFDRLTNLEHLYMGVNDLESLSDGVFDKLTRLQYLSIASNDLVSLPDGVFDKLTKLRWLTMSSNNIASLRPGIFENLLELERLYTYGNGFSCIPRNAFGSRTDDDLSTIILVYPNTPEIGICSL